MQHKKLFERISADKVEIAAQITAASTILPISALEVNINNKKLKQRSCLFHGTLDHFLNDDRQLVVLLSWGSTYGGEWEVCKNLPEETISMQLARMCKSMPDRHR